MRSLNLGKQRIERLTAGIFVPIMGIIIPKLGMFAILDG